MGPTLILFQHLHSLLIDTLQGMAATSAVSILGAVVGVTPPDFFHCNRLYGTGIQASDCITAATMFPEGNHMIPFAVGANDGLGFPMQKSHG